ncbi:MAG: hypothetical protein ACRERD_00755 [Candidatus Binatia bacterium]
MSKKIPVTIVDQQQGLVMTNEGLLIPGKFLRKMGTAVSVAFSPRLIVISAPRSSPPVRRQGVRKKGRE